MTDLIRFSDDELAQLTGEQQAAYLEYLEAELTEWKLTPKQQAAEDLAKTNFIVGYGGAAGGGKSDWGLYHVYHYCKRIPKSRWLILRTKLPELKRSLIPRSREKFDDKIARYRQSGTGAGEWTFTNGSVIEFGYLNSDDDVYQYKSAEYDGVFIDEATETSKFAMRYLMSRIRIVTWRKKLGAWPHMILCTNPGGPGHAWFKADFVKATNHGEHISEIRFEDPLTGDPLIDPTTGAPITRSIAFVPAFVWDNPHMPEEYKLNLLMLDETEMRQLLYGDWDVFAGQFFSAWRHQTHVIRPFLIPPEWPRVRALDFGTRNPYCCLWAASDWDSNIYVYRETYQRGLNALEQAEQVVSLSKMSVDGKVRPEKFRWSNADPAVFKREGSGKNVAQQWAEGGLQVRPAKNDRIGGWSLVRQLLRPLPGLEYDFELDDFVARAKIRVFANCENLIRTIPDQIHDDVNVEDMHKNDDDHACFPAGTMVTLERGQVPIEQVQPGDRAWTRLGWSEVLDVGVTGQRLVSTIAHQGGRLTATPDHPIWVDGRGWTRLDALRYGDLLWQPRPSSTTAPDSVATPTPNGGPTATTSPPGSPTSSAASSASTSRSTSTPSGPSLRAATSTTETRTRPTTTHRTSWRSPLTSIEPSTLIGSRPRLRSSIWPLSARPLPSGIGPTRGGPGTGRTPSGSGRIASPPWSSASSAGPTSTPRSRVVRSSAPGDARPRPVVTVYNLTVRAGEFVADGVLVHNCDTLRYLAQGYVQAPPRPPRRHAMSADEKIWADYAARVDRVKKRQHPILGAMG